ncbi:TNF receptor-associated factor 4-like [Dysidea avara]|uniref:TNF receptor-associated factor 4-like n=1 Tax=Dysidea avara TaxID=196820 RepID=UPI0033283171
MAGETSESSNKSGLGGHDHRYVDSPPERLVCVLCYLPCRDPFLSVCCGHNFCRSCMDGCKEVASAVSVMPSTCPVCRHEEFVTFPNKQADREIKSLHVMCTNEERGCEWQDELNDINNHLGNSDGCQFEDVKCSNECGKMLQRQYLTSHVETECPCRKVDCQYCHITGEHQFIEGEHKEQCPKFPLPCPNDCSRGHKRQTHLYRLRAVKCIPREDMEAHRKKCPLEEIKCSLKCGKILQRQNLTSHVETECPRRKVDCQYCHITGEHQFIEGEHKEQCPKLPIPCPNKCKVRSLLREDMEAHRKGCLLEVVQCDYHNVGCEERMLRKRKREHEEEKMEEHLIMTKLKLTKTEDKLFATEVKLTHRLGNLEVMLHRLIDATGSTCKLVDSLQWSTHLSTMATRVTTVTQICPATFKVSKFTENKQNKASWYSDPFYTDNKGYACALMLMEVVLVKILTCQCMCTS